MTTKTNFNKLHKYYRIPKKFDILGNTITVKFSHKLFIENNAYGLAIYQEGIIKLQAPSDGLNITKDFILSTFEHEKAHFVLYYCYNSELTSCEKTVDSIGQIYHQINKTSCY